MKPCGRRRCPYCGPNVWRPPKLASLHSGLRAADPAEVLVLLLTAPGDVSAVAFNRDAPRAWNAFLTAFRREHPGRVVEFWKVAELQDRGHVHFHVVVRGLRSLSIATLRRVAVAAGFGKWVGVRWPLNYRDGAHSVGGYLAKYLLKSYAASGGVVKLITQSRGWRGEWSSWKRKWPRGTWLYAGGLDAGWALAGQEVAAPRRAPQGPPWRAPWWSRSWQAARASWASSGALWGDE